MKGCLRASAVAATSLIMMAVLPTSQATRMLRGSTSSNSNYASLWSQTGCSSSSDKPMYKKKDGTCWLWLGDPMQAPEGAINRSTTVSSADWVQAPCTRDTERYKKADGSCWAWAGPPEFKPNSWEAFFFATIGRTDPFKNQPWPYAAEEQPAVSTATSAAATP